jgi:hypothetical protein
MNTKDAPSGFKDIPKRQMVVVDWLDSTSNSSWQPLKDIDSKPVCCRTIGYCLKKDKKSILVAASLSDLGHSGDHMCIPRSCVCSVRRLVEGGGKKAL